MIGQRKKERWNKTKPCNLGFVCELGFEGRGRERKAYGEVNPCLGVLKK